ncbi:MAG: hypothetical protein AAFU79_18985 [Myxococcota bacterium]
MDRPDIAQDELDALGAKAHLEDRLDRASLLETGLELQRRGGQFILRGRGAPTTLDLRRRLAFCRILLRLARAAREGPSVQASQLVEAGWPGETPQSGGAGVYRAISASRRMGFRGGGYQRRARSRARLGTSTDP